MRRPTIIILQVLFASLLLLDSIHAFSLQMSVSSKKQPFCLNAKMSVRPDQRGAFIQLLKSDQKQSLATEPGCLQFVVGEDTSTPNTFYLHEEFDSQAAFQEDHTQTSHYAEMVKFVESNPWSEGGEPVFEFYFGTHDKQTWPIPSQTPVYCLNVNLYPKPELRDEFLKVIAANKKGSDETEPLCLQYVYGESTATPNLFHFHEAYAGAEGGKEGFDAHASAPHFAAWEAFASTNPFTKPPEVYFFRTLE